jgi:hypothetical protein
MQKYDNFFLFLQTVPLCAIKVKQNQYRNEEDYSFVCSSYHGGWSSVRTGHQQGNRACQQR